MSEQDHAVASKNMLNDIASFTIINTDLKSDHKPIAVTINIDECEYMIEYLLHKSESFMSYNHLTKPAKRFRTRAATTDITAFHQEMGHPPTSSLDITDCDKSLRFMNEKINSSATKCRKPLEENNTFGMHQNRWLNIPLKDLWASIGWNGLLENRSFNNQEQPKAHDFKRHYEALLNVEGEQEKLLDFQYNDAQINEETDKIIDIAEVEEAVVMKDNSSGPDEVAPGLIKHLPTQWIQFLVNLLNFIFMTGKFPVDWILSLLVSIFKKGPRSDCGNYRGICMIDAILKVYDRVIDKRMKKWWKPDPEQIGNQSGIACMDHVLSLHILISMCKTSKRKLYILFVDFSKAYDRVSRSKLMKLLRRSGCGRVMLRAILLMYKVTRMLYEDTTIETNTGVKQGSPSSGFLFTFFINPLIGRLKELGADGFLDDLHALLMMDDSVIMATTRENFIQKIDVLLKFCDDHGMLVNELKTKFMVINHSEEDKAAIVARPNLIIKYTEKYVYLGATITDDGNMLSVMKEHAAMKNAHLLKFTAFNKKNENAPFYTKRQVFRACILSTVLYSCEGWCTNNIDKSIRKIYMTCIRSLLGVRISTDVDLCLHEIMMPSIEVLVHETQRKYYMNVVNNVDKHPLLCRIMEMGRNSQLPSGHITKCKAMKHIDKVIATNNKQCISQDMANRRDRIAQTTKTKSMLYKLWCPTLAVHDVYTTRKYFPEHWRIAWTRFRLGSTNLPCEKGRWNDRNNTKCLCNGTQTETHILLDCAERITHIESVQELFSNEDQRHTMKQIFDTLKKFEKV